jgi:NAD(P)-dependent dehydrogenase (short-subunit alcohol dehydrogenase family)
MHKTILITGATDGIGLATAKMLSEQGHHLLIHGRNIEKLTHVEKLLSETPNAGEVTSYIADLSNLSEVIALADEIKSQHNHLDVLINNAGVFKANNPITPEGLDVRFVVNTIAPYLLTKQLLSLFDEEGRVVNLSSAAQAKVDIQALKGGHILTDMEAYAQSKLAITMWTASIGKKQLSQWPIVIAVNPGSLLASKMVKEGFGVEGADINIGAKVLRDMTLESDVMNHSGEYFDNDSGQYSKPHIEGSDQHKIAAVVLAIEEVITRYFQ